MEAARDTGPRAPDEVRRTRQEKTARDSSQFYEGARAAMAEQLVQILRSLLVLIPFMLAQADRMNTRSKVYLVLNLIGSGAMAVDALITFQWGFLLLEGAWAIVSALGLAQVLRGRSPRASGH
jgi:hypothetical protein